MRDLPGEDFATRAGMIRTMRFSTPTEVWRRGQSQFVKCKATSLRQNAPRQILRGFLEKIRGQKNWRDSLKLCALDLKKLSGVKSFRLMRWRLMAERGFAAFA